MLLDLYTYYIVKIPTTTQKMKYVTVSKAMGTRGPARSLTPA